MTHQRFYALAALIARKAAIWTHGGLIDGVHNIGAEADPGMATRFCDEVQHVIDQIRKEAFSGLDRGRLVPHHGSGPDNL